MLNKDFLFTVSTTCSCLVLFWNSFYMSVENALDPFQKIWNVLSFADSFWLFSINALLKKKIQSDIDIVYLIVQYLKLERKKNDFLYNCAWTCYFQFLFFRFSKNICSYCYFFIHLFEHSKQKFYFIEIIQIFHWCYKNLATIRKILRNVLVKLSLVCNTYNILKF